MIADLKPYPAMKDSGVDWLGDVPEDWEVLRGRRVFEIRKRIAGELGHSVISVTQAGLRIKNVETGEGQVSQDYSKYQVVKAGEFAMNSMDLLTGGVGIADTSGVTSPDYRVFGIRPNLRVRSRYMLHVLRVLYQNRGFYAWGQGSAQLGRWRLPRKRFNDFPFPVPPEDTQAAIVQYLDHVDRRVRRLVRAKRKLIALIMEQKQVIIHRAVTRGLDPDVALKDIDLDSASRIPAHWDVVRASTVSDFHNGKAHEQFVEDDAEFICVTARFVSTGGKAARRCTVNRCPARIGDVLMVMSDLPRGRALARSFLTTEDDLFAVNQRVCILRPIAIEARFLAYYANRNLQLLAYDDGSNQTHLSNYAFKTFRVLLPPRDEQTAIADYLDKACQIADTQTAYLNREIDLLNEYRTRLIADVVTGKLDVREVTEELPEINSLDEAEHFDDVLEADGETDCGDLTAMPEEPEA